MALKIKIKKCGMVRKIEGVKKSGFYGKVIANGKKSFEEILKASCKNTTLDYREAELACKMFERFPLIGKAADSELCSPEHLRSARSPKGIVLASLR